jgi:hypothetical protein
VELFIVSDRLLVFVSENNISNLLSLVSSPY